MSSTGDGYWALVLGDVAGGGPGTPCPAASGEVLGDFVDYSILGLEPGETNDIDVPAGTSDGDIMLIVSGQSTGFSSNRPASWDVGSTTPVGFWHIAASEPGSYSMSNAGDNPITIVIWVYQQAGSPPGSFPGWMEGGDVFWSNSNTQELTLSTTTDETVSGDFDLQFQTYDCGNFPFDYGQPVQAVDVLFADGWVDGYPLGPFSGQLNPTVGSSGTGAVERVNENTTRSGFGSGNVNADFWAYVGVCIADHLHDLNPTEMTGSDVQTSSTTKEWTGERMYPAWVITTPPPAADLYLLTGLNIGNTIHTLDAMTGDDTAAGNLTGPDNGGSTAAVDSDASGILWAVNAGDQWLVQVDPIALTATIIASLDRKYDGIAWDLTFSNLYVAVGGSGTSDLYTMDPGTGATTSVGAIGYAVTGLAFDPGDGTLYGVTSNLSGSSGSTKRRLITINTGTGAGTLVGAWTSTTQPMTDITFASDGTLYGWSAADDSGQLWTLNKLTGEATAVGSPTDTFSGGGIAFIRS